MAMLAAELPPLRLVVLTLPLGELLLKTRLPNWLSPQLAVLLCVAE
jgi:hypothetical protein